MSPHQPATWQRSLRALLRIVGILAIVAGVILAGNGVASILDPPELSPPAGFGSAAGFPGLSELQASQPRHANQAF